MFQHHSDLRMVPLLELSCPIWIGDICWIFPSILAATVSTSLSKHAVSRMQTLVCMMFVCMELCASYLI